MWYEPAVQDEQALYTELYTLNHERIARLCRMLMHDSGRAEEVCQDVFLKLLIQLRSESRNMDWPRWLTRVAVNACRDLHRASWWKVWQGRSVELVEEAHASREAGPEHEAVRRDEQKRLRRAFQGLSARQREIFVLRHFEGWQTNEVAELLGLSSGTVKQHLFRAVRRMRATLGDPT